MTTRLRDANDADYAFSEHLSRSNMQAYISARDMVWDPKRFADSWQQFENFIICRDNHDVGLLRLLELDDYLEIRDLQLLPSHFGQGIGSWAITKTACIAQQRKIAALRLRVYEENPALKLYLRSGFEVVASADRVFHMVRILDEK